LRITKRGKKMTEKNKTKNFLERYKNILITATLTLTLLSMVGGLVWGSYLNPKIDARVEIVTKPLELKMDRIEEELIFVNCQFSVTLPDSLRKEAEELFEKAKRLGKR